MAHKKTSRQHETAHETASATATIWPEEPVTPPENPPEEPVNPPDNPDDTAGAPPGILPGDITLPGVSVLGSPLLTAPVAKQGTRFYSPLVSGSPDQIFGVAQLAYRFDVGFAAGSFNGNTPGAKLQFPPGAMLIRFLANVSQGFAAASVLNFGTTPTGAQIASLALNATGIVDQPPLIPIPANGIVYVSAVLGSSTTGAASVAILYLGQPAAAWS